MFVGHVDAGLRVALHDSGTSSLGLIDSIA
jgi:hypothetical protein